jgi:hypothetical protein
MPVNVPRIVAALNAYPWTTGCLTERRRSAPTYCAIGALLRYAGVAQDHIASARGPRVWSLYGTLLRSEYGIPDARTMGNVMVANDTASSQAEAIERVLGVLTGMLDADAVVRETLQTGLLPDPATGWPEEARPDDETGSLALVV